LADLWQTVYHRHKCHRSAVDWVQDTKVRRSKTGVLHCATQPTVCRCLLTYTHHRRLSLWHYHTHRQRVHAIDCHLPDIVVFQCHSPASLSVHSPTWPQCLHCKLRPTTSQQRLSQLSINSWKQLTESTTKLAPRPVAHVLHQTWFTSCHGTVRAMHMQHAVKMTDHHASYL